MKQRIVVTGSIILSICAFTWFYLETGWPIARYSGGIAIPSDCEVRVSNTILTESESEELRDLFRELPSFGKGVYTKPDFEVVATKEGSEATVFSIWLDTGFIYDGFYLNAWTERMIDDKADVFRINRKTAKFLSNIITRQTGT